MKKVRVKIYVDTTSILMERDFILDEADWEKMSAAQEDNSEWLCLPNGGHRAAMIPTSRVALIEVWEYIEDPGDR